MKLLITFLLTTLITLPIRSQDKIEGIGKFKIGKSSINITNQIATEFLTDIKLISNMSEQYKSYRPSIVELETNRDNSPDRPRRAPYWEKLRVFYINKYKVADIEIESIYLTFKDGILIEFLTEKPRSILTPIAQKYGEAKTAIRYDSSYCWYDGKKKSEPMYIISLSGLTGTFMQQMYKPMYTTKNVDVDLQSILTYIAKRREKKLMSVRIK